MPLKTNAFEAYRMLTDTYDDTTALAVVDTGYFATGRLSDPGPNATGGNGENIGCGIRWATGDYDPLPPAVRYLDGN